MSETPQEKAAEWVVRESGKWEDALGRRWEIVEPEIREAIRAVLEDLRLRDIDCGCNNRVTRLEAERDALREQLHLATISDANEMARANDAEAERDALRSTVHGLSVQLEEGGKEQRALREIMRRLVHGIDEWNAAVTPIIGRPVDYKWLALEEARDVLAPEVKP